VSRETEAASIHNPIAILTYSDEAILVGSLLMLVSIVASAVSSRLGAPLLLVFLILGMLWRRWSWRFVF
jgi:hypothetical protein